MLSVIPLRNGLWGIVLLLKVSSVALVASLWVKLGFFSLSLLLCLLLFLLLLQCLWDSSTSSLDGIWIFVGSLGGKSLFLLLFGLILGFLLKLFLFGPSVAPWLIIFAKFFSFFFNGINNFLEIGGWSKRIFFFLLLFLLLLVSIFLLLFILFVFLLFGFSSGLGFSLLGNSFLVRIKELVEVVDLVKDP